MSILSAATSFPTLSNLSVNTNSSYKDERNIGRPDHKACGHQNEYEGSLHLAEGRDAMGKPATGSFWGLLKISQ